MSEKEIKELIVHAARNGEATAGSNKIEYNVDEYDEIDKLVVIRDPHSGNLVTAIPVGDKLEKAKNVV